MTQVDGVPQNLAKLIFEELDFPSLWGVTLNSEDIEVMTTTWAEYAFSYAAVINTSKEHTLKVGGTMRLLQGLAAVYAQFTDLTLAVQDNDTVSFIQSHVSYGHSDNLTNDNGDFGYRLRTPASVGMDFGMVYSYNPTYRRGYLFELGVSMMDAGSLRFQKGTYAQDFYTDVSYRDIEDLKITSIGSMMDTIEALYTVVPSADHFSVQMPTHVNLFVDWNIGHGFYLHALASVASFHGAPSVHKLRHHDLYALTPRYENKWVGVYMPLTVDATGGHMGLGLRLAPVIVGTSDLLNWIAKDDIHGLDANAYLKITIPTGGKKKKTLKRKHTLPAACAG
jgi:hypothetical protein